MDNAKRFYGLQNLSKIYNPDIIVKTIHRNIMLYILKQRPQNLLNNYTEIYPKNYVLKDQNVDDLHTHENMKHQFLFLQELQAELEKVENLKSNLEMLMSKNGNERDETRNEIKEWENKSNALGDAKRRKQNEKKALRSEENTLNQSKNELGMYTL